MSTKRSRAKASPPPRAITVFLGMALGFGWGTLMWLISELVGRDSGVRGWLYVAITCAMIGGGVAAIFGATAARRRGERITPRLPGLRRKNR